MHTYFIYKLFVSSLGSAVNILLVTPEKAIKLTANDAFRYVLLNKQGYIEAGSLLIFERRILNVLNLYQEINIAEGNDCRRNCWFVSDCDNNSDGTP
jgi:hypothetical protein